MSKSEQVKADRKRVKDWRRRWTSSPRGTRLAEGGETPVRIDGDTLARIRKQGNLSQTTLAQLVAGRVDGISTSAAQVAISRLESGKQHALARRTALGLFEVLEELVAKREDQGLAVWVEYLQLSAETDVVRQLIAGLSESLNRYAVDLAEIARAQGVVEELLNEYAHELNALQLQARRIGTELSLRNEFLERDARDD